MRHKQTGLIRLVMTLASQHSGQILVIRMCLGTPGMTAVRRLLLSAMTSPGTGPQEGPSAVFVAHRMFPIFYQIAEFCKGLGITPIAETAAEAKKSAAHNDTDWQGFNNRGEYGDEDDSSALMEGKPDPNNGHKAEFGGPAAAAAAGAPAGPSRQQQGGRGEQAAAERDQAEVPGGPGTSSRSSSSRQKGVRVRPHGLKVHGL